MLTNDGRLLDLPTNLKRPKMCQRSVMPCFLYRRGVSRPYSRIGLYEAGKRVGNLGTALQEQIESDPHFVLDPEKKVLWWLDAEVAHLEPAFAAYP